MYSDILRNNQVRPGIIQAYSELRLTLMYSEPEAYSEPCQKSTVEHFAKKINDYNYLCKL